VPPSAPPSDLSAGNDRIRLVEGDSAPVLGAVAPESVDAVVCDPPHGILQASWDVLPPLKTWPPSFASSAPEVCWS